MELYFSFPGESDDFINHAAPTILRLIAAMGYAQTNATVKAVHAVLLRATSPERVGYADKPVYQAMGVPASTFTRWKKRLDDLRADAAPAEEPGDDALAAAGMLVRFASAADDAPSAPPSPPLSSGDSSPDGSGGASPLGDGEDGAPLGDRRRPTHIIWMIDGKLVTAPTAAQCATMVPGRDYAIVPPPRAKHDPLRARWSACHAQLCGGAPPFAAGPAPTAVIDEFWCHRTAADAFVCLACGTRFQSIELERRYQREAQRAASPDGGYGAAAEAAPATSLGAPCDAAHPNEGGCTPEACGLGRSSACSAYDGPPGPAAQEREALLADGLGVPCELADEYGGLGLRYAARDDLPVIPAGTVIGVYPTSAGLRTRERHYELPERRAGAHRGEYAMELRGRMLYARAGQRGAGSINEHFWPNVEFAEVDADLGAGDHSLFTLLAVVTNRRVSPGDLLHADYGKDYQAVRSDPERGYTVTTLSGPRLPKFSISVAGLDAALRRAFNAAELLQLRGVGGVIDFDGDPGARGDPNKYRGGPSSTRAPRRRGPRGPSRAVPPPPPAAAPAAAPAQRGAIIVGSLRGDGKFLPSPAGFDDVGVDRRTPLGNPFLMGADGRDERLRDEACEACAEWLEDPERASAESIGARRGLRVDPRFGATSGAGAAAARAMQQLEARLRSGENLRLMCWCAPKRCHGDGIAEMLARRVDGATLGFEPRGETQLQPRPRLRPHVQPGGGGAAHTNEGGCAPEAHGLGRSSACSAYDGPPEPPGGQIETRSEARACPACGALQPGATDTARAGCRCGGGPCRRCGVDSCACPWSDGAPLAPRPTRAEQNPAAWGYVELPLHDPYAPSILIVGEFSGEVAGACRRHFPRHVTLTVDFRRAEGGAAGLHYCGDARDLLYTRRWRLIVAHPPCRAAALSNTIDLQARVANGELWFGMAFSVLLYCAPADVAVVEQPASQLERAYRAPDTRLQFLNYGVGYSKEWCLWHRGGDFCAPPPTTPGAAASVRAPHRIVQHDRAERERVRSRTPPAIADVLCRAINLEAHRPRGQPLYHEELARLEAGYRRLTGCAPPDRHDDPLARAVERGEQRWQPRAAAGHPARATAATGARPDPLGSGAAGAHPTPDGALDEAAAGGRPDMVGGGAESALDTVTGGKARRAPCRCLAPPHSSANARRACPPRAALPRCAGAWAHGAAQPFPRTRR